MVMFLYQSEQSTQQSSVCPTLMPGLVAKAVLCLGLIKIKSNPGSTAHEKTDRPADHHATHQLALLPMAHLLVVVTCLLSCQAVWTEGVTQGPASRHDQLAAGATAMYEYVVDRWKRKIAGAAWVSS